MPSEIGLFEAIHTQRAIRKFKPDPVPDEMIRKLIESATKAPSGANRQHWRFIVIREPEFRRRIGEYYLRAWQAAYENQTGPPPKIQSSVRASAADLAHHMHEVPVMILACIEHDGSPSTMSRGSSIYPAVQNLLLAARGLGLGTVITSLHKGYEAEIKELLGIPNKVETAALLPYRVPRRRSPLRPHPPQSGGSRHLSGALGGQGITAGRQQHAQSRLRRQGDPFRFQVSGGCPTICVKPLS